jgi:predicted AAA+ superfamily ATPase
MSEKEILMQLISDFQEKPSDGHVLIRRENSIPLYSEKIITITGVRRSGKTTCMMQLIEDLQKKISRNKIIFINFEDERFTTQPSLFEAFLEAWHELFPNEVIQQHWFFFDEIQNIQS